MPAPGVTGGPGSSSAPRHPTWGHTGLRMSKLYAALLVIASQFAMAALGMLILVVLADVSHLVAPTHTPGMNP